MPRTAKGARLWLEPEERGADGKIVRRAAWVIRDGARKIRTGCARVDGEGAERALSEYIAKKYTVTRERGRHPSEILVLDVLKHLPERQSTKTFRSLDYEGSRHDLGRVLGR